MDCEAEEVSMTTGGGVLRTEPPTWSDQSRAVVVGIDGSARNQAAVGWAIAAAKAGGRPLTLLYVLDERRVPSPFHAPGTDDVQAWCLLDRVEAEVRSDASGVVIRKEVVVGPVAACLVDRSAQESALVVGRRGFGRFLRLLVGSTSVKVASLGHVPVVVVPDRWSPHEHASEPVVVGVDRRHLQPAVLHYAFSEARLRRVSLVAAHGRDQPTVAWDTSAPPVPELDLDQDASLGTLDDTLERYRRAFPDVDVSVIDRPEHPLTVLLDEVRPSQLLVLGRHGDHRHSGFPFGSVAQGVLFYAEVPVAIVPPSS
jgi:nucleotide-binding universal stress UspA family protein